VVLLPVIPTCILQPVTTAVIVHSVHQMKHVENYLVIEIVLQKQQEVDFNSFKLGKLL